MKYFMQYRGEVNMLLTRSQEKVSVRIKYPVLLTNWMVLVFIIGIKHDCEFV